MDNKECEESPKEQATDSSGEVTPSTPESPKDPKEIMEEAFVRVTTQSENKH